MDLNQNQLETLNLIYKINNSISSFASLIIIILYIKNKRINNFCLEHTLHISISIILSGVSAFMEFKDHNNSCLIGSFLGIFSNLSTILWVLLIGKTSFYYIVDNCDFERKIIKIKLIYYLTGYGLPLLISCMVILTETWGVAGPWCWLSMEPDIEALKLKDLFLVLFFSVYWIITLMTINYVYKTLGILNQNIFRGTREYRIFHSIYCRNIIVYPIICIIVGIPRTINRLIFVTPSSYYLYLIQTIFDSIQGLLFSIAGLITFIPIVKQLKNCFNILMKEENNDVLINEAKIFIRPVENMNKNDSLKSGNESSRKTFVLVKEEISDLNK